MPIEETIRTIIQEYGAQLWVGFVTLVVTGFVLGTLKGLVEDLVFYVKARMSDVGFGQRVYYRDNIYLVRSIHFKYIVIYDDKKVIRIPLKQYMNGPVVFPQPRYDDFDEKKYHEPPWDGQTERRGYGTNPRPLTDPPRNRRSDTPNTPPPNSPTRPDTPPPTGGGAPSPTFDVRQLRKEVVDLLIAVLIGPSSARNILPSMTDEMEEDAEEMRGKLSEEDFNNINTGIAALVRAGSEDVFEEINTRGVSLTQEDIEAAKRQKALFNKLQESDD